MLTLKIKGKTLEDLPAEMVQKKGTEFHLYEGTKSLGTVLEKDRSLEMTINPFLNLEEFQWLHDLVFELVKDDPSSLNESNCQLGYLENGEKAYLIKNWESWKTFLMKAKLRTLEGQNVMVKNEDGEELGTGLLAEYELEETPFRIVKCSLITLIGEKQLEGKSLTILPMDVFH